jgi:hypothetical protein
MFGIKQESPLQKMYGQVKDLGTPMLLAGLAVLVKSTANYIHAAGLQDQATETFRQAYLNMMNNDRPYWWAVGPQLYEDFPADWKVSDIIKTAVCESDLCALDNTAINREWTRAPGWFFFKTYTRQIKADIIGGKTLDELKLSIFNPPKDKSPEETLLELAKQLADRSNSDPTFFYPVMLYLVLLLKNTNFVTLK